MQQWLLAARRQLGGSYPADLDPTNGAVIMLLIVCRQACPQTFHTHRPSTISNEITTGNFMLEISKLSKHTRYCIAPHQPQQFPSFNGNLLLNLLKQCSRFLLQTSRASCNDCQSLPCPHVLQNPVLQLHYTGMCATRKYYSISLCTARAVCTGENPVGAFHWREQISSKRV